MLDSLHRSISCYDVAQANADASAARFSTLQFVSISLYYFASLTNEPIEVRRQCDDAYKERERRGHDEALAMGVRDTRAVQRRGTNPAHSRLARSPRGH